MKKVVADSRLNSSKTLTVFLQNLAVFYVHRCDTPIVAFRAVRTIHFASHPDT